MFFFPLLMLEQRTSLPAEEDRGPHSGAVYLWSVCLTLESFIKTTHPSSWTTSAMTAQTRPNVFLIKQTLVCVWWCQTESRNHSDDCGFIWTMLMCFCCVNLSSGIIFKLDVSVCMKCCITDMLTEHNRSKSIHFLHREIIFNNNWLTFKDRPVVSSQRYMLVLNPSVHINSTFVM